MDVSQAKLLYKKEEPQLNTRNLISFQNNVSNDFEYNGNLDIHRSLDFSNLKSGISTSPAQF